MAHNFSPVSVPAPKPKSKGQRVKTFTAFIPQPDGSHEKTTVQVYLNADARFVIYLDEHIGSVIAHHARQPKGVNPFEHTASGHVFEHAKETAELAWTLYTDILREAGKSKVILISHKANRRGEGEHHGIGDRPCRVSFAGNQAVQFSYSVVWRSGDQLYSQRDANSPLRFVKNLKDIRGHGGPGWSEFYMVEWTQEREDFLAAIDDALADLISRLSVFFGHGEGAGALLDNLTQAIALGGGLPALPAPETT